MLKPKRPPSERTRRRHRAEARAATLDKALREAGFKAVGKRAELIPELSRKAANADRRPPDGAALRAALERVLADHPALWPKATREIARATLDLPPSRGRVVPAYPAVAAKTGHPLAKVRTALKFLATAADWQPISTHAAWIRAERREHARHGHRAKVRTIKPHSADESPGWAEYHRRADASEAQGEDLWAALVRLYFDVPTAWCEGCRAPLYPPHEGRRTCNSATCRKRVSRAGGAKTTR